MKKLIKYGCLTLLVIIAIVIMIVLYVLLHEENSKNAIVVFPTAKDLSYATDIKFPEVEICDRHYHRDFRHTYHRTWYVLQNKDEIGKLRTLAKQACVKNPDYWQEYSDCYQYIDDKGEKYETCLKNGELYELSISKTSDTIVFEYYYPSDIER